MKEIVDWLVKNKGSLFSGLLCAAAVAVAAYRWMGKGAPAPEDYIKASSAYAKWENSKQEEHFETLLKILARRPELHAKFDAPIGQRLLEQGKSGAAAPYIAAVLNQKEMLSPLYHQFSDISVSIVQGELKKALEQSKQLQEAIEQNPIFKKESGLIYAYNLVRIAFLEQEAGTPEGEALAWKEVVKNETEGLHLLRDTLKEQNISLPDYIKYRTQILRSG